MRSLSRSDILASLAFLVNVAFPLVTTPLVAAILGSDSFSKVSLVALLSYIQSALVEGSVATYGLARWGTANRHRSALLRVVNVIVAYQFVVGLLASVFVYGFGVWWLKLSPVYALLGVLAGFAPVLYPSWALMLLGRGAQCLRVVLLSRLTALGMLLFLWMGRIEGDSVAIASLAWLVVPAVMPSLISFSLFSEFRLKGLLRSKRLLIPLSRQLQYGVFTRVCVICYSTVSATLIGRYFSSDLAGSYFFLDRLRVVGQTVLGSQYPVIKKIVLGRLLGRSEFEPRMYLMASSFLAVLFFFLYLGGAPQVLGFFASDKGFVAEQWQYLGFSLMGALVVASNSLLFFLYLPKFGQVALSRVLAMTVCVAVILVPCGMVYFGMGGILYSAVLVELFLLLVLMVEVLRRRK